MAEAEWIQLDGKWYYLKSGGIMCQSETYTIDGKAYNFDSNGVCTNP